MFRTFFTFRYLLIHNHRLHRSFPFAVFIFVAIIDRPAFSAQIISPVLRWKLFSTSSTHVIIHLYSMTSGRKKPDGHIRLRPAIIFKRSGDTYVSRSNLGYLVWDVDTFVSPQSPKFFFKRLPS